MRFFFNAFLINQPGFKRSIAFVEKDHFKGEYCAVRPLRSVWIQCGSWASGRPCRNQKQCGPTRWTTRKPRLSEVWEESLSKVPGVSIRKQNLSREIVLWPCLASGSVNSEQMIDKYLLSYLVFVSICVCWVFLHSFVFLPFPFAHMRPHVSFALLHSNSNGPSCWLPEFL